VTPGGTLVLALPARPGALSTIASGGLLAGIYFRPKRNPYNGGWAY
jgi:hypothetical protein